MSAPLLAPLRRWLAARRFPQLLVLLASLWLVDVLVPDVVPFVDEILLTIVTLLIGSLRRRPPAADAHEAAAGEDAKS